MHRACTRLLALAITSALSACAPPSPLPHAPVPEPTEPLRPADRRAPIPSEARVADYALTAHYDEEQHLIDGRARITWRNRGPAAIDRIPFHLYMNGFRAPDTAWMQQARGKHRGQELDPEHPWGYVDVHEVMRVGDQDGDGGSDGKPAITKLRHAETDEPSLMTVWLDQPVAPGEEVVLKLAFTTQLPRVFARTGFSDRYVMAGQWFPKPGVLMPDGTWRAHPFTLYSEFFADFGHYDVELDLPGDLVVGATGILVSQEHEGTRQRLHYRAEMVHDFAWTAGPDLVEAWDDYEGIRIRALVPRERAQTAHVHLEAQRAALASMEARFGPYPWSTITVVEPPEGAEGAMGMEYPTFYTTSSAHPLPRVMQALGFDERMSGQFTTVHEFGHQYFQGLLASDEFTQPWLDEGLNTFSNALVYMDRYGADEGGDPWLAKVAGHPLRLTEAMRLTQGSKGFIEPLDQSADRFSPLVGSYSGSTYQKTAATLMMLRRLVGAERFDHAMHRYTERFAFRHPSGADLEGTFIETLGAAVTLGHTDDGQPIELRLSEYFDQALRSSVELDFRVHRISNRPRLPEGQQEIGWRRDEHLALVGGDPPEPRPEEGWPDEALDGAVVIHRRGEFLIPVEIEVELSDGTRSRVLWDGRGRYRVLQWPGHRVVRATIDPDRKLVLETRRYDDTRYADDERPPHSTPNTMGRLGEAAALALGGAFGP